MLQICKLAMVVLLPALPATAEETPVFSGKTTEYTDTCNGYKLKLPVEFTLQNQGASPDWEGLEEVSQMVGNDAPPS
ncbi:MAG: hypothetical protein HY319_06705 [Armatimonadetes bacterium]|nr:hypothetical protein [Armatimonadota bacterium]